MSRLKEFFKNYSALSDYFLINSYNYDFCVDNEMNVNYCFYNNMEIRDIILNMLLNKKTELLMFHKNGNFDKIKIEEKVVIINVHNNYKIDLKKLTIDKIYN